MAHYPILYDLIKVGYKGGNLKKYNYVKDDNLSSHNHQVYYSPERQKMLFNVTGTHNKSDWITDGMLGLGLLKSSNRYKESDKILKKAREKYNPLDVTVTGHSLGSAIAQNIASKQDKIITLDGAYTLGQRTRGTHYRTSGDVVSLLGSGAKHTVTLKNPNLKTGIFAIDALNAHSVDNIKGEKIFV